MTLYVTQRNGRDASAEGLSPLAFAGYAHFTAMQVRDGRIRGLDLHLERLRNASLALFGRARPDEWTRRHLRTAIAAGPDDLSLTAVMYSSEDGFITKGGDAEPDVLIRTGPPASGPDGPLAVATVEHERMLPTIKHVGEIAKTYYMRQAALKGFDDAAFVDGRGRISEASIWNLAFWDGEAVVWPEAEKLGGITMGIVRRQLERLGVPQREQAIRRSDLPDLAGAVVMNSWTPGVAVHRFDEVALPEAPTFLELLHRAYGDEPLTAP